MNRLRVVAVLLTLALTAAGGASAATMQASGEAIILTGRIMQGDDMQLDRLLSTNPSVKVVILYDSPGGDGMMMQHISAAIRGHLLATAVAGYCNSACAMIFLSGVQRYFTDLVPIEDTSLGFHGSYFPDGRLTPERRLKMIAGMVASETDGKANPTLVQRWTHLPRDYMVRFTYPGDGGTPKQTTVFECPANRRTLSDYSACTPLPGYDAVTDGIVTSAHVLHVAQ